MTAELDGKIALVTGSSRGIGKEIALELARQGCDVVVCARTESSSEDAPGSIGETAEAIRSLGRRCLALRVDVESDADLTGAIERTIAEFGRIDILVNNAAQTGGAGPFLEGPGDAAVLDRAFRINVHAPYVLAQLAARQMAQQGGGTIVNISSPAGEHVDTWVPRYGPPEMRTNSNEVYAMTKAALNRMGTSLVDQLAAANIAIITVSPGLTLTEQATRRRATIDRKYFESVEVCAKAVAFVCSAPMSYTGKLFIARDLHEEHRL